MSNTTAFFMTLTVTAGAAGAWPQDPGAPATIGAADSAVDHRHVVTDDGATWIAWIDSLCSGNVRVQRIDPTGNALAPGGVVLDEDESLCGTTEILLAACSDDSVIVRGAGPGTDRPLYRIGADGTQLWGEDGLLITEWIGAVDTVLALDNGDVLLGGHAGNSCFISRRDVTGAAVWTTGIPSPNSSNRRVIGLVPDDAGGAFIVWDGPLTYTRLVLAHHVDQDGASTWTDPLVVVPSDPSSSRHTDPVVLSDGAGGCIIVFAKGTEAAGTPVPLLMQRFDVNGTFTFPVGGARISLASDRQYDAIVTSDPATSDLLVVWRDGPFADQELRAQRLGVDGTRRWGDQGIALAALGQQGTSSYDAAWTGNTLAAVVSRVVPDTPSVTVRRVDGNGMVAAPPGGVSDVTGAMTVRMGAVGDAVTVSWFDEFDPPPGVVQGDLVAQRVNADGTLGLTPGDLDADGDVDFNDLLALLNAWGPCAGSCPADLNDDTIVGFGDLLVILANWS